MEKRWKVSFEDGTSLELDDDEANEFRMLVFALDGTINPYVKHTTIRVEKLP